MNFSTSLTIVHNNPLVFWFKIKVFIMFQFYSMQQIYSLNTVFRFRNNKHLVRVKLLVSVAMITDGDLSPFP